MNTFNWDELVTGETIAKPWEGFKEEFIQFFFKSYHGFQFHLPTGNLFHSSIMLILEKCCLNTITTEMAYLTKNDGIVLAPAYLPESQPLPSAPGLMPYLENRQLNQCMAPRVAENNSGVQSMFNGKLKGLGITEILTGIISIIIGTVQVIRAANSFYPYVGISIVVGTPWWSGVAFVIAGSLAVAVEKSPTDCMVKGCLSSNIISAISCFPALVLYSVNLSYLQICSFSIFCIPFQSGTVECMAILLVLTLLNAAISISISSFNCKAMNCCNTTPVPYSPRHFKHLKSVQHFISLLFSADISEFARII
uniref:membrane-spanning 4-domains subfamily A member 15-like n=1 Tax=Pristiophorus japonicus TaxID=55135 RepID=UPI00398E5B61